MKRRPPKQETVLPLGKNFAADEMAGSLMRDQAAHAGLRYRSPRTGALVAQSVAEAEFSQSFDGIGTEDHEPGGLWDFEQEQASRPTAQRWPHKAAGRYDDERMVKFADENSREFSDMEVQVYSLFWPGRMSYGQVALRLGKTAKQVRECVQRLRARCARVGQRS